MLKFITSNTYYLVYPSWGKFKHKWDELPDILSNVAPPDEKFWGEEYKTRYDWSQTRINYINGPEGGGIIEYDYPTNGLRWKGDHIFDIENYSWNGTIGSPQGSGVCYLTQRTNKIFLRYGIEKRFTQYHLNAYFDHVQSVGDNLYLAFVSEPNKCCKQRPLKHFIELACYFHINVTPLDDCPKEIASEKSYWFRNPRYDYFTWFQLKTDIQEVRRLFAFLMYCGLALKSNAPNFQLVAQIEGNPSSTSGYHDTPEVEMANRKKAMEAIDAYEAELKKLPPEILKKALRNMKRKAKGLVCFDDFKQSDDDRESDKKQNEGKKKKKNPKKDKSGDQE